MDVRVDLKIAFLCRAGVTAVGSCGSIGSAFDWRLAAGVPHESSYVPTSPTGFPGVLAGGWNGAPVDLASGRHVARAAIEPPFALELALGMESFALANGVVRPSVHRREPVEAAAALSSSSWTPRTCRCTSARWPAARARSPRARGRGPRRAPCTSRGSIETLCRIWIVDAGAHATRAR